MIAKAMAGSLAASLFLVLLPLATTAAAIAFCVIAAVCWMSLVHVVLSRIDGQEPEGGRLPVAERAPFERPGAGDERPS